MGIYAVASVVEAPAGNYWKHRLLLIEESEIGPDRVIANYGARADSAEDAATALDMTGEALRYLGIEQRDDTGVPGAYNFRSA